MNRRPWPANFPPHPLASMSSALKPLWPSFEYKPHQLTGIHWMLEREDKDESGGLLCDEMGLGKTMEVLGVMKNSKKRTTLLLCPKAVISQWVDAASKSDFNVWLIEDYNWSLVSKSKPHLQHLFITNYEKMTKPSLFRRPLGWNRIVLDEAHRVRNDKSEAYKTIAKMERDTLWAVSATPIVNDIKDMNNLFKLVGFKGSRLNCPNDRLEVIHEACLHRSMEEMRATLKELPSAPIITKEVLDFATQEEGDFYRSVQGKIAARWKHIEHDISPEKFALLMKLRQLSLHPQVYIGAMKRKSILGGYDRPDWDEPSTKFMALRDKIDETQLPTRWIVFCQFHDEMEILQAYLESSPAVHKVSQYHGGLTQEQKDAVIDETKAPLSQAEARHEILLLQLQSGGVGLNLQHFTKIIFMSPWWTAALMDQAIGRAVRIGQKETVEVFMLVLKEEETMNIDETMLEKAESKRGMLEKAFIHASRGLPQAEAEVA